MSLTNKSLDRVQSTDTQIKLVMPQKVLDQIKYLCKEIPKVEWSGMLFYKLEGSIRDPKNMVLTLEEILPLNKGTQAYTEYTIGEEVVDHLMKNEHLEECKVGHIHSHNTMAVFFSGTDWSELEDNAPNHNFYLSLIVNNFMEFCAKVCFISESKDAQEFTFWAKDENGQKYAAATQPFNVASKKLMVFDCDIDVPSKEITVSDDFTGKVKGIIEKAAIAEAARVKTYTAPAVGFTGTGGGYSNTKYGSPNTTKKDWNSYQSDFEWGDPDDKEGHYGIPKTSKKEDDSIPVDVEKLAMLVLNTGNAIDQFADIDDICENYLKFNLTPGALKGGVLASYNKVYTDFMKDGVAETKTPEFFIDVTELVIDEYRMAMRYSTDREIDELLKAVVEGLERLVINFKKEV